MSFQNKFGSKRLRRGNRLKQKSEARGIIPFAGCVVTKLCVKSQRYLQAHGLPHSANVANIVLPGDFLRKSPEIPLGDNLAMAFASLVMAAKGGRTA